MAHTEPSSLVAIASSTCACAWCWPLRRPLAPRAALGRIVGLWFRLIGTGRGVKQRGGGRRFHAEIIGQYDKCMHIQSESRLQVIFEKDFDMEVVVDGSTSLRLKKSASDVTLVSWSSLSSEQTLETEFRLHLSDNLGKISLSGRTLASVLGVVVAVATLLAKLHRADSASPFHTTPNTRHSVI
jgi:hypothetical protein